MMVLRAAPDGEGSLPPRRLSAVLAIVSLLWLAACLRIDQIRWDCWDIGIDTASWGQIAHHGSHGRGWLFTCYPDRLDRTDARSTFSAHSFWLTPWLGLLYRLWPHPLVLYASVHVAHAFGALLIGLIAWRLFGDEKAAIGSALLYLLVPAQALAQTRFDFAFRHWSLLFIPLAVWLSMFASRLTVMIPLLLLAAAEENLSLIAGFLCFTFSLQQPGQRAWFAAWGTVFCLYVPVAILFIIPSFIAPGFHLHYLPRYAHLTQGFSATTAVLFTTDNAKYLFELLAPMAFLPIWKPGLWLLPAIPFAAQNLLSVMNDTRMIGHHYSTPLSVTLFIATLFGLATMTSAWRNRVLAMLVACSLILSVTWYPSLAWLLDGPDARSLELRASCRPLEALIKPESTLSAPPAIASRFWYKSGLWFFPQGSGIADVVVIPKFLPGYPELSADDLHRAIASVTRRADVRPVFENADLIVYERRESPAGQSR